MKFDRPPARYRTALNLGLLGLAFWLRLTMLGQMPVFVDEGSHLSWAQRLAAGQTNYPWLMHGKLLLGVAVAQFPVNGPAPLWLGRAAVAILSVTGCAACLALGRRLGPWPTAPLAGGLYAILPFAVFHERQILADPLMACAGSIGLAACLKLAQSPAKRWSVTVALALAACALFKLTGLVYLGALGLSALVLGGNWPARRRLIGYLGGAALLAGLVGGLLVLGLGSHAGTEVALTRGQSVGYLSCPPLVCAGDLQLQLVRLGWAAAGWAEAVRLYLGWPVAVLALLAWPLANAAQRRRAAVLGWFCISTLAVMLLTATESLPPRYYLPLVAPLAALAASSLVRLGQRLAAWVAAPRVARLATGLAGAAVLIWPLLTHTGLIISTPLTAALPAIDEVQYRTGKWAGTGFPDVAAAISTHAAQAGPPALIVVDHFMPASLAAYFDPTTQAPQLPVNVTWPTVTATLAAGGTIYVVDEVSAGAALAPYPRVGGANTLRLRIFEGLTPANLQPLYELTFGQNASYHADYAALADRWQAEPRPGQLATYPPNQLFYLRPLVDPTARSQLWDLGSSQPWDPATTIAELNHLSPAPPLLTVIYRDETRLDPQRTVEAWLNTHLYWVGEQWVGPLRWVDYASAEGLGETVVVQARFGDNIVLHSVDVLDPDLQPGGLARFALHWRATGPISESYKIFLHIFTGNDLIAQHDGQAMGELRPTFTWQTDEAIADQFALRLPATLPAGQYQWRVGLYDVATQARLPARLADGTSAEFFTGGFLTVK